MWDHLPGKDRVTDRWVNSVLLGCSSSPHSAVSPSVSLLFFHWTNKTLGDDLFSREHIHRQNCLEDYGVKVVVQKLKDWLQDMWVGSTFVWIVHPILVYCACALVWDMCSCMRTTFKFNHLCRHPWACVHTRKTHGHTAHKKHIHVKHKIKQSSQNNEENSVEAAPSAMTTILVTT